MEQLYADRNDTGDITFLVESERIAAHRSILAAQSPMYRTQFYGSFRGSHEVFVPNVSAAAFNVFLQLFYKETVDLTMDNIQMVLDLAKQSLVDEFIDICGDFLKTQITAGNFFDFYELAIVYDIDALRLECEWHISENTMNMFESDDFLHCDRDVLNGILKMNALNCNEIDVFAAGIRWALVYCQQNGLDRRKRENLRAAFGDAIYQIRFSLFSAAEFTALNDKLNGFFTVDESNEILRMIKKLNESKPHQFNQNAMKRLKAPFRIPSWLMQCKRHVLPFRNASILYGRTDEVTCVNFSFACSKPIGLYGIAIGFRFDDEDLDNLPASIFVSASQDANGPLISYPSKYKVYKYSNAKAETILMFAEPIERITHFSCTFRLPSPQLLCNTELDTYVVSNGTRFRLVGNSVHRLYFDLEPRIDGLYHDYGPLWKSSQKFNVPIYHWSSFSSRLFKP